MKKHIVLILLVLGGAITAMAQNRTISGILVDADSGEPLAYATVAVEGATNATITDDNGKFTLKNISAQSKALVCSYVGYEDHRQELADVTTSYITIKMTAHATGIEAVVVSSIRNDQRITNTQIGVERIEIESMVKTPALFGEKDIVKTLTLLPGVKTDGDGSSGFQVRGGTATQNLILLDDAPIYNAGHMMGLFSVFNSDALTNASLYKGLVPAQFGGASSSIFDINTKAGSMQDYNFSASIGLLSAKVMAEGPVIEDRLSFFVSARRSYFDLFLAFSDQFRGTVMNFYDINARVDYKIDDNNRLSLSLFRGEDNMGLVDLMEMQWGNSSLSLNWFHSYGGELSSNTTAIFSDYNSDNAMNFRDTESSMAGFIKNYGLKHEYNWDLNDHTLKFGAQTNIIDLQSAEWFFNGIRLEEVRRAWENNIWVNDEYQIVEDKLAISAGLRLNAFSVLGGAPYYELDQSGDNIVNTLNYGTNEIVGTHWNLEPRLSMNYRLQPNQSLKLGYSRTSQHIHAIRNSTSSMPFDRYTMTSNILLPEVADQVSLGYTYLTPDEQYEFTVEGYYKTIDNIYDYKDGKSFNSAVEIETLLLGGKGRSYGMEFLAKKNIGRFTGWVGYTLSWTENKIDGINNNQWYVANNDRRHDISVVAMYELSPEWSLAATWVYNTGQALTAPSAKYDLGGETIYYYAERNGYRAPDYHRLDVSFTHTIKKENHTSEWSFGVYNLYNRYNPYMITFENDPQSPTGTKTIQTSLFGIIPSVSYTIKF